jgi:hypothetical protein
LFGILDDVDYVGMGLQLVEETAGGHVGIVKDGGGTLPLQFLRHDPGLSGTAATGDNEAGDIPSDNPNDAVPDELLLTVQPV